MSLLKEILEIEKRPMSYQVSMTLIEKSLSLEELDELRENAHKTIHGQSYLVAIKKRKEEIKSSELYHYYRIGKRICKKNKL